MSIGYGASAIQEDLIFNLDPNNIKSVHPVGVNSPNYSPFKDLVSGSTLTATDNVYHNGKTYYTCYGLTYPESSQIPASRDGVTPGINDITSAKLYSASRDLNMYVFDETSGTWISDSYFNGERIGGHCYDTYDGLSGDGVSSEHTKFQQDYDAIKLAFPNATFLIIGSHAAENNDNNTQTLARLQELGLPDSHIGVARPEYVLVGKPNNPSRQLYLRENISLAVGQMNIGLPLDVKGSYGLNFSQNQYIDLPGNLDYSNGFSQFAWFKSLGTPTGGYHIIFGGTEAEISIPTTGQLRIGVVTSARYVGNLGSGLTDGNWHYVGMTYKPSEAKIYGYIDGVNVGSIATDGGIASSSTTRKIGQLGTNTSYYANGDIGAVQVYKRLLTDIEVKRNFNAYRGRYEV